MTPILRPTWAVCPFPTTNPAPHSSDENHKGDVMKKVADLRSGLIACARGIAGSLFLLLLLSSLSLCQLTTYHINSAPDTPLSGANQSDYDTYALSTSYPGSLMTGATVD